MLSLPKTGPLPGYITKYQLLYTIMFGSNQMYSVYPVNSEVNSSQVYAWCFGFIKQRPTPNHNRPLNTEESRETILFTQIILLQRILRVTLQWRQSTTSITSLLAGNKMPPHSRKPNIRIPNYLVYMIQILQNIPTLKATEHTR